MSYIELKSGTDIRGVASDLGGKTVNLTEQAVYDITAAFIVWYINKYEKLEFDFLCVRRYFFDACYPVGQTVSTGEEIYR